MQRAKKDRTPCLPFKTGKKKKKKKPQEEVEYVFKATLALVSALVSHTAIIVCTTGWLKLVANAVRCIQLPQRKKDFILVVMPTELLSTAWTDQASFKIVRNSDCLGSGKQEYLCPFW